MSYFTVKTLASRWACSANCIYQLINAGNLKAMNLTPSRRRATYRIFPTAVEEYELRMKASPSSVLPEGVVREFV